MTVHQTPFNIDNEQNKNVIKNNEDHKNMVSFFNWTHEQTKLFLFILTYEIQIDKDTETPPYIYVNIEDLARRYGKIWDRKTQKDKRIQEIKDIIQSMSSLYFQYTVEKKEVVKTKNGKTKIGKNGKTKIGKNGKPISNTKREFLRELFFKGIDYEGNTVKFSLPNYFYLIDDKGKPKQHIQLNLDPLRRIEALSYSKEKKETLSELILAIIIHSYEAESTPIYIEKLKEIEPNTTRREELISMIDAVIKPLESTNIGNDTLLIK